MKADLHNHLLIGFQDYWQKLQGYEGRNLADVIFNAAARRDIGIVAITSQENMDVIPKGSVHDRINYLKREALKLDKKQCSHDSLGPNSLIIERKSDKRKVIIISGQTVRPTINGQHYDHLVVGSNQVPNNQPIEDTLKFCADRGLIQIAEHPYVTTHSGLGEELLKRFVKQYNAVEINAQMIWPEFLSKVPVIGKYNKGANKKAQTFAHKNDIPWVATSDAHHPNETGLGYMEFPDKYLRDQNEEKLLHCLNIMMRSGLGRPIITPEFTEYFRWLKWTARFAYGMKKYEGQNSTR